MRHAVAACLLICAFAATAPRASASNDSLFAQQWGLGKIGASTAWGVAQGEGVVIAIVDSGVDLQHVDLNAKVVPGKNFVDAGQPPLDDCGHGTHVAGIAAAATGNGLGVAGVAPRAKIMPVRVLASDGSGGCGGDAASAGIRWAVDHGARVINMSFGADTQPIFGSSFSDAIRYAWSKGAIPVVSAGNEFILSSGFGDEPAIVVAATDRYDSKPLYSSGVGSARWGISAPGGAGDMFGPSNSSTDILSTYFDPSKPMDHSAYATMAGTSMAAPFVSGAAAVLLSMGLSKEQVVDRLLQTADDIGSPGTFGHGRLNLARAVSAGSAASARPSTPAPTVRSSIAPPTLGPQVTGRARSTISLAPSAAPPARTAVVTPAGTAPGSYAAPKTPDEDRRSPVLPIAVGLVGLAAASSGAWMLYRSRAGL